MVTTPIYYCENVPGEQLTAIGDTLRWYYQEQGGIPSAIAPTPNTTKKDSLQYWVTQTIDGCESDRNTVHVVVTFRPNGIIVLDKKEICAEDSITISYYGSAFPTAAYNWTLPDKGATLLNGGFDQGPLVVRLDTPGTAVVTLRVGATGCMSDLYTESIKVKGIPNGKITVKDDLCLLQTDLVSSFEYTKTVDSFIWDFDGGETSHFATDQGPYGVQWATPGKKYIKIRLVDEGCSGIVIDSTIVHDKPNATIVADNYKQGDLICVSDSIKVSVQNIEPGSSYTWSPSRFFDTYSDIPVTYARIDFSGPVKLKVVDEFGCENTDSLVVKTKSCCEMYMPNAFTPDNNGQNDMFKPITNGNRQIKSFKVFNRFGQAVYETVDINRGWDGTLNGKAQDIGTYYYLLSFMCDGKLVDQKGEVILVR